MDPANHDYRLNPESPAHAMAPMGLNADFAFADKTDPAKTLSLDDRIMMNFYFMPDGFDVKIAELLIWDGVTGDLTEANATKKVDMTLTKHGYGAQALGFAAEDMVMASLDLSEGVGGNRETELYGA